ncbi:MAG TPA: hypothetical protein VFE18_04970 [Phenylobacterium sp.]|jgi:hypothetical protein|uniref:hypothetical protein n=1 Tax=Phenylobacterium sp. TaxID=1871053 RepID=UPI002D4F764D|nr:hypothetical protein [Phenylobacterium sp.]HZZ67506.1 hypothetical protein [Phenylobacterium sp.]
MLTPIGPGIPPAFHAVLTSMQDAIRALQTPAAPQLAFAVAQAGLPPAASYPQCMTLVSDLNLLAHSDGVHWIREDTGAVIV